MEIVEALDIDIGLLIQSILLDYPFRAATVASVDSGTRISRLYRDLQYTLLLELYYCSIRH